MLIKRSQLCRDPETEFGEPRHIVECGDLPPDEKLRLLDTWRADLIELLTAEEENMQSQNVAPSETAEMLMRVCEALALVRHTEVGSAESPDGN